MRIGEHYQVGELLGQGAFGSTFAGRDLRSGGEVVLKRISVRGLPGWKPFDAFEREVAVLRALDHPGVPRFLDAFEAEVDGGLSLVLVMERIEGESLLARIQRGHRWPEAAARDLLDRLLETLDYLHRLSPPVIHRDIKPGNIMVRPDGRPVLVDFGAVHDWGSRAGHGSLTVTGTVGYMAPEQAMGAPVPASDLYGLGATLVHTLSHCHPADLPRRGLLLAFEDRLGCSPELVAVLKRLVHPDLEVRYSRASAARAELYRQESRAWRQALVQRPQEYLLEGGATAAQPSLDRDEPTGLAAWWWLWVKGNFRSGKTLLAWGIAMGISSSVLLAWGVPGLLLAVTLPVLAVCGALTFGHAVRIEQEPPPEGIEARPFDAEADPAGSAPLRLS